MNQRDLNRIEELERRRDRPNSREPLEQQLLRADAGVARWQAQQKICERELARYEQKAKLIRFAIATRDAGGPVGDFPTLGQETLLPDA